MTNEEIKLMSDNLKPHHGHSIAFVNEVIRSRKLIVEPDGSFSIDNLIAEYSFDPHMEYFRCYDCQVNIDATGFSQYLRNSPSFIYQHQFIYLSA
jgi:hypothetical protein